MKRMLSFTVDHYLLLPLGAALALLWANTGPESYFQFAHALAFPVNDIGMVFFLGLMTKEIVEATAAGGALHSWRLQALPLVAAVGGMIGAVLAYQAWLQTGDEASVLAPGWPIACAIDLALSYFIVKAIFERHPALPFVIVLGIATDGLALVISELRYPRTDIHPSGAALMVIAVLMATSLRRSHVRNPWPYIVGGGGLSWIALYWGGLHPVLALVPIVPFLRHAARDPGFLAESPPTLRDSLSQFERHWKYPVQVVVFLFGLVNAGVVSRAYGTGTWAVLVGALVGKPLGILAGVAVGAAAGLHLPQRLGWREVIVIAWAASAGFTFGLLLTSQAFWTGPVLNEATFGALLTVAGVLPALAAAKMLGVGRFGSRRLPP